MPLRRRKQADVAATRRPSGPDIEQGLGINPLDGDAADPLTEAFYRAPTSKPSPPTVALTVPAPEAALEVAAKTRSRSPRAKGRQPLQDGKSFRLVTFSFYEEDVARLDELLREARTLGHRRASRSQIVRLALRQVDLAELPDDV